MKEAKFGINELLGIGFTLVVLGIGMAYGLDVMTDVQDDMGTESCAGRTDDYTTYNSTTGICQNGTDATSQSAVQGAAYNATGDGITGVAKIPEKMPTIATVIVASVIIGILVTYLWARFSK